MKKLAIIATLMIILFSGCSEDNGHRKIKLSSRGSSQSFAQSFTTTIRFEENDRQSIAVLLFKNKTGDDAMEWMQKGISEMFIRSLSQSNSLSVISMDRLAEIEERIIRDSSSVIGVKELSQKIGREANVDAVIFGSYERAQQRLRINVKLMDPINGFVLKEETETGEGIEQIFDMVDALTNRVKDDLQVTLAKSDRPRGITEITTNSLQAWRYYTEGREAKHKFMVDDAHELYLKAIKLDSNFVSAYLELCEVCYSKGAYEKAAKCFSELKRLKEKATPIEKYQIELLEAVQSGDVTEYMETLSKWVQDYPRNLQVHWNLSALYNDWNNPERALEHLSYVVNIDPKYKLAYNLMAYQHAKLGNFEKAVAALNAYMDISADEANPYDSMGDIHFFFGKYDKAEKYFHKALEKNDKFFPSLLRLAALYLEQGDDKKAEEYAKKYLDKIGDKVHRLNALHLMGSIYLHSRDDVKALQTYETILDERPYDCAAYRVLYDYYDNIGDTAKARYYIRKSYEGLKKNVEKDLHNIKFLYTMAERSVMYGIYPEESINMLANALEKSRNDPNFKIDEITTINLKFYLTLLYGQKNELDKIVELWPDIDIFNEEMWEIFKTNRNQNYSTDWQNYHKLNDLFEKRIDLGREFYEPLIMKANQANIKNIEMMFRLLYTNLNSRFHDLKEIDHQLTYVGAPKESQWMVYGPFDNFDGFRRSFAPEKMAPLRSGGKVMMDGKTWEHAFDGEEDGFIDFKSIFDSDSWSVAYAAIDILSPKDQDVQFRFGSDDGFKIWLNGVNVWALNQHNPAFFDDNKVDVNLNKGYNRVIVKVCNTVGDWGFFFRVTDKNGDGLHDIKFNELDRVDIS